MGYRSDVKCVIGFKDPVKFAIWVARLKNEPSPCDLDKSRPMWGDPDRPGAWDYHFSEHVDEKMILFEAPGVKWYESYPEISAFMKMLERAEEFGAEYEFIRIGEEPDDIEKHSSYEGDLDLYSILAVNVSIDCSLVSPY